MLCNMCGKTTNIASTQYAYSQDRGSFPELTKGGYEFEVGGRYIYQTMRQPTFVIIVDSHIESLTSGLFTSVLSSIKQSLDSIPNAENTSVCIMTVDTQVTCYSISSADAAPKVYVIQESKEMFAPVPPSQLLLNCS